MVYLVLTCALACLTVKGFCGKKASTYAKNSADVALFNLVRLALCFLISAALLCLFGVGVVLPTFPFLLIALLSGCANAAFLVGWMIAVQKNTIVAVDVTLTLGSLIPALLCALFFCEIISASKMLGFALILFASLILSTKNRKTSPRGVGSLFFLCFAVVGDGMIGFSQQLFKQFYTPNGVYAQGVYYQDAVFHFYTYLFAAVFLLFLWLLVRKRRERFAGTTERKTSTALLQAFPYIFTMAVCLFLANDLQLRASAEYGMPTQILYPIIRGGCLITANVTALFFGEHFTARTALGTFIALCGILLMNLL